MTDKFVEKLKVVPMVLVMGTIFFLSHQPGDSIDLGSLPGLDKLLHGFVYGVLALSVILALGSRRQQERPLMVVIAATAVCFAYGVTDEFHQSFIPNRFVSAGDIVADIVGAVIASTVWYMFRKRQNKEGKE